MLQSLIYRIVLITSAWFIIQDTKGYIPNHYLYLATFLYFIIYSFLKSKGKSLLRLCIDFIFINIIIWGRDIDTSPIYIYILLPIINAINYSGKKSHSITVVVLILGTILLQLKHWENHMIFPLFGLWLIYISSFLKRREWNTINEISQHIDGYFINQKEIMKPHLIYEHIITELNKYFFSDSSKGIMRIRAYTIRGQYLWLIRASTFLWERKIALKPEEIELIKAKRISIFRREDIVEVYTYIKQGELEYVFICDVNNTFIAAHLLSRFSYVLIKTFSKVSLLHNYEYRITSMRNEKFDEIKDNVLYVNKAVNVMHFIRNKMTPLTNLVAFHKEKENMNEQTRNKMLEYLSKLTKQADNDLKDVLQTADYLLDKSSNPFIEPEFKDVHITKLYIIVSEIVERLLEGTVEATYSLREKINTNSYVKINIIEVKIIFTDWINNMRKYMKRKYSISLSISNSQLIVCFENDYECNDNFMQQLVKDLNSTSKNAVLAGKDYGHGISIIKSIANEQNISLEAKLSNGKITLKLFFDIYGKEENPHF